MKRAKLWNIIGHSAVCMTVFAMLSGIFAAGVGHADDDRWAAIAINHEKDKGASSHNLATKEEAQQAAVAKCKRIGGNGCHAVLAGHDCIALLKADNKFYWGQAKFGPKGSHAAVAKAIVNGKLAGKHFIVLAKTCNFDPNKYHAHHH